MKALGEAPAPAPATEDVRDRPGPQPAQLPRPPRAQPQPRPRSVVPVSEPFEDLARLAMTVLDVPSVFIAFPDRRRTVRLDGAGSPDDPDCPPGRRDDEGGTRQLCRKVIGSGGELLVEDMREAADRTPATSKPGRSGEPVGLIAWAGVPMLGRGGEVVGAMCVADRKPRHWSEREVDLLRSFAVVASGQFALRARSGASRRHAEQRAILATALQESLLPPCLPKIPGLQIAARYAAGGAGVEVLGDFYNVFPSIGGSWGVVVGDVCGRGVQAAKAAALARYTLSVQAHLQGRPSLVLATLNHVMLGGPTADNRLLTAIYATVRPTPAGAYVQISSAGHPLALVHRAGAGVESFGQPGSLLGLFPDPELSDSHTTLHAGDSLILFTDGVTGARSSGERELFGDDRLREAFARTAHLPAARIAESVQHAVLAFSGKPAEDDTVILVLKTLF